VCKGGGHVEDRATAASFSRLPFVEHVKGANTDSKHIAFQIQSPNIETACHPFILHTPIAEVGL
jgi:hypothetical protein